MKTKYIDPVSDAFRNAVREDVVHMKKFLVDYYTSDNNSNLVYSQFDDTFYPKSQIDLDHYPLSFITLRDDFLSEMKLTKDDVKCIQQLRGRSRNWIIEDKSFRNQWKLYHWKHAHFRLLSRVKNELMGNHQNSATEDTNELTIHFGRYKGKTYEYVYTNHPSYCEWVLEQDGVSRIFKDFQHWIQEQSQSESSSPANVQEFKQDEHIQSKTDEFEGVGMLSRCYRSLGSWLTWFCRRT